MKENKNFKLKSICHSCVSENPAEYKALYTAGSSGRADACPRMTGEQGRSMIEMLGVLAVIGVLSVTGVGGYMAAMKRHRANELLNEASKRAAIVAVQAMQGRETLSIAEFPNNAALKFSEIVGHDTANKQFTLTITGVAEAVCQQMNNAKGPVIRKFIPATCTDNATVELTYNDDMSTTEKACDFNGNKSACEADSSRQYCAGNDTCISATDTCPSTGPSCPSGSGEDSTTWTGGAFTVTEDGESITCYCAANKSYKNGACSAIPSSCDDHTTNQCGLGYYCQFTPMGCDDTKGGNPNGTCTAITGGTEVDGHWVGGPRTDWWSANSWCIGKESSGLITYATLSKTVAEGGYACDKSSTTSCDWTTIEEKGLYDDYWSAEVYSACDAWVVDTVGGFFVRMERDWFSPPRIWCE